MTALPSDAEAAVLGMLDSLGIAYVRREHPPVHTVEEARAQWAGMDGEPCKNLFLRNYKGNRHYLVVTRASRRVDLKDLTQRLSEDRLSFASPERLRRFLGVEPGAVSPFGLINDAAKHVVAVIEAALPASRRLIFHPNVNTASLEIAGADFERFLAWTGARIIRLD